MQGVEPGSPQRLRCIGLIDVVNTPSPFQLEIASPHLAKGSLPSSSPQSDPLPPRSAMAEEVPRQLIHHFQPLLIKAHLHRVLNPCASLPRRIRRHRFYATSASVHRSPDSGVFPTGTVHALIATNPNPAVKAGL